MSALDKEAEKAKNLKRKEDAAKAAKEVKEKEKRDKQLAREAEQKRKSEEGAKKSAKDTKPALGIEAVLAQEKELARLLASAKIKEVPQIIVQSCDQTNLSLLNLTTGSRGATSP